MVLKLIIEITFVLFILSVLLLLIFLRKYIKLMLQELALMSDSMKSLSELEEANMELIKHLWQIFGNIEVQSVDNNSTSEVDNSTDIEDAQDR